MRKFVLFAMFYALALPCHAIIYNSLTSGNWNNSATWTPTGIPSNGDRVFLANGVNVTIPAGYTAIIGTSPGDDDSTTPAISCATIAGTGGLIIYGTLIFRGSVIQCNSQWTVEPGGTIQHDSSLAASPSATHYFWQIGTLASQANASLLLDGLGWDSANVVTVNNAAGSGTFGGFTQGSPRSQRIYNGNNPTAGLTGAGRINASYTVFQNLGVPGYSWSEVNLAAGQSWTCSPCRVTGSTTITHPATMAATANFIFNGNISSPKNPSSIHIYDQSGNTRPASLGIRTLSNSAIDGTVNILYGWGWNMSHTVLGGSSTTSPLTATGTGSDPEFDDLEQSVFWNKDATGGHGSIIPSGTWQNNISIRGGTTGDCDHFHSSSTAIKANLSISGLIAEQYCYVGGGNVGGGILILSWNSAPNVITASFSHIMDVPTYTNGGVTRGASAKGAVVWEASLTSNITASIRHVTKFAQPNTSFANSMIMDFESPGTGAAGMFSYVGDNLIWRYDAGSAQVIWPTCQNTVPSGTLTSVDRNWTYNVNTTTGLSGSCNTYLVTPLYWCPNQGTNGVCPVYAATPGTHDGVLATGPQFVDGNRNLLTWAATIDPTVTTYPGVLAKWMQYQTDSWSSAWDWNKYYAYIKKGFSPQNQQLKGVASDGGDIGAFPVIPQSGAFWWAIP